MQHLGDPGAALAIDETGGVKVSPRSGRSASRPARRGGLRTPGSVST
jgi:hypothetical protein